MTFFMPQKDHAMKAQHPTLERESVQSLELDIMILIYLRKMVKTTLA